MFKNIYAYLKIKALGVSLFFVLIHILLLVFAFIYGVNVEEFFHSDNNQEHLKEVSEVSKGVFYILFVGHILSHLTPFILGMLIWLGWKHHEERCSDEVCTKEK